MIPNMNNDMGTRSLEWHDHNILSIGGGINNLAFFDMRKDNGYIEMDDYKKYYKINQGWIQKDRMYDEVTRYQDPSYSIYTHKYNPHNNRIFVAGGPTEMAFFGSHITILE